MPRSEVEKVIAELSRLKTTICEVETKLSAEGTDASTTANLLALYADLSELAMLTEQKLLHLRKQELLSSLDNQQESTSNASDLVNPNADEEEKMKQSLIGQHVSVPHWSASGIFLRHNAVISGVQMSESRVLVMLCNPTRTNEVPCSVLLDRGHCYRGAACRHSHGMAVAIEDLGEYTAPDFSLLREGTACLVQARDATLWRHATVEHVDPATRSCVVKMRHDGDMISLDFQCVLPVPSEWDESSSSEEEKEKKVSPVIPWCPDTKKGMGEWEQHTRGFGSAMLAKMGFVPGEGLGRHGQGRAEPVPIELLPQGKSLDRIMQLKEKSGDAKIFDPLKRKKCAPATSKPANKQQGNVFDFINTKLHTAPGPSSKGREVQKKRTPEKPRDVLSNSLNSKSDKSLNVQLIRTQEEIARTESQMKRARACIARNQGRDRRTELHAQNKLTLLTAYLDKLKASEKVVQRESSHRREKKKLTVF